MTQWILISYPEKVDIEEKEVIVKTKNTILIVINVKNMVTIQMSVNIIIRMKIIIKIKIEIVKEINNKGGKFKGNQNKTKKN